MNSKQRKAIKRLIKHFGYAPKIEQGIIGYPNVVLCHFYTLTVVVETDGHCHS